MNQNDYNESDMIDRLKNKKPSETKLRVRPEGIDLIDYENIKDAAKEIGISKETLLYAYHNGRPLITRRKGGFEVFYISPRVKLS